MSDHLKVAYGNGAGPTVLHNDERHLLPRQELPQTGTFNGIGVDKDILTPVIALDEAEAFRHVVRLHLASQHQEPLFSLSEGMRTLPRNYTKLRRIDLEREERALGSETDQMSGQNSIILYRLTLSPFQAVFNIFKSGPCGIFQKPNYFPE